MGACTFVNVVKGKTAKEAFEKATAEARHQEGHGGYSGTIAEKLGFIMIPFAGTKEQASEYADKLIIDGDKRIDNKWGPAGCLDLGNGEYMFFGWASE